MVKISDAELEVMKVIWKRKDTTSLEIIEDLKDTNWNFNTIRTLIKRLLGKGAIEISGRSGKAYRYRPVVQEDEYKNEATKDLLKRLFNNSISEFVLEYCESPDVSAKEIKAILKQIEEDKFGK